MVHIGVNVALVRVKAAQTMKPRIQILLAKQVPGFKNQGFLHVAVIKQHVPLELNGSHGVLNPFLHRDR